MAGHWMRACALIFASVAPLHANPLTPDQRADIVQTMREAFRQDPSILREALIALQADEASQVAAAASGVIAAQRDALVADAGDPVLGNPYGTTTVVEFYDPRCPYCRQMLPVFAALLAADPTIRLVLKEVPILGPASVLEARALLAAHRQGGYARLQAAIMGASGTPTLQSLRAAAEREGLDGARFEQDMADPAIADKLDSNLRLFTALHIDGTPALVVGGRLIPGAVDLAELQRIVAGGH